MAIEMLANEALPAHATSNTDAVKKARDCRVKVLANANPVVQDTSGVENSPMPPSEFDLNATHLISSPYRNLANQLRLESLGVQSRLFAFALTNLKPVQDNYAVAPYLTVFNWPFIFETLRALCNREGLKWKRQEFYVVIFRSKLRADTDQVRLGELDQKSHEEACTSGSLLHYWFGKADAERRNLATCIWVTREDAAAGGRGSWHRKARVAARDMYETISFHTHSLVVEDGARSWELRDHVN